MTGEAGSSVVSRARARLVQVPPRFIVGAVGLVVLGAAPYFTEPLMVYKLTGALYFSMFVISWDFVSGYTGKMSFGHTFFFAIGGYTAALLNLGYDVDPLVGIAVGTVLASTAGLILGGPALRLEGPYLAFVTLVAPLVLNRIFIIRSDIFGGIQGLPNPVTFLQGEDFLGTIFSSYYVAFVLLVAILAVTMFITRSDTGWVFNAIKADEEIVAASGLNATKFKILAFVVSAGIGGLAAGFYVHSSVGSASPSQLLALTVMIEVLIASILGGMGTISGALVGGLSIFFIRDWLSGIETTVPLVNASVSSLDHLLLYVLILGILFFLPEGIVPWVVRKGRSIWFRITGRKNRPVSTGQGATPGEQVRDSVVDSLKSVFGRGGNDK